MQAGAQWKDFVDGDFPMMAYLWWNTDLTRRHKNAFVHPASPPSDSSAPGDTSVNSQSEEIAHFTGPATTNGDLRNKTPPPDAPAGPMRSEQPGTPHSSPSKQVSRQ